MKPQNNAAANAIGTAQTMATHLLVANSTAFATDQRRAALVSAFRCWPVLRRAMSDIEEIAPNCASEGYDRDKALQEAMG